MDYRWVILGTEGSETMNALITELDESGKLWVVEVGFEFEWCVK